MARPAPKAPLVLKVLVAPTVRMVRPAQLVNKAPEALRATPAQLETWAP